MTRLRGGNTWLSVQSTRRFLWRQIPGGTIHPRHTQAGDRECRGEPYRTPPPPADRPRMFPTCQACRRRPYLRLHATACRPCTYSTRSDLPSRRVEISIFWTLPAASEYDQASSLPSCSRENPIFSICWFASCTPTGRGRCRNRCQFRPSPHDCRPSSMSYRPCRLHSSRISAFEADRYGCGTRA